MGMNPGVFFLLLLHQHLSNLFNISSFTITKSNRMKRRGKKKKGKKGTFIRPVVSIFFLSLVYVTLPNIFVRIDIFLVSLAFCYLLYSFCCFVSIHIFIEIYIYMQNSSYVCHRVILIVLLLVERETRRDVRNIQI